MNQISLFGTPTNDSDATTTTSRKRGIGSHQSPAAVTTTWLTPRYILDPLGKFDLDPCSAPDPTLWPTAETHYTAPQQNGLALPWFGRVWLNPPYTSADILKWMSRMADHNCGIAFLFARVETNAWFKAIWSRASALLFLDHRPHFHEGDGTRADGNSGGPLALISYGDSDAELLLDGVIPGAAVPLNRSTMLYALTRQPDEPNMPTWREVIRDVVNKLDKDQFRVSDIYNAMADHPKIRSNPNWKAKIRQTIAIVGFKKTERDTYQTSLFA